MHTELNHMRLMLTLVATLAFIVPLSPIGQADHEPWEYYWDYVATYTIDDTVGTVSFVESGELAVLACSVPWQTYTHPVHATTDLAHKERIAVTEMFARYETRIQKDGIVTVTESVCLGSTTAAPIGSCAEKYGPVWTPASSATFSTLESGWHATAATTERIATAPTNGFDRVLVSRDLTYAQIRPELIAGAVPFTGRFYFTDPVTQDGIRSESYIAGRCISDGATELPGGCCAYAATAHTVEFGATRTQGVGIPPIGPLGSWSQRLLVCNLTCS